MNQAKNILRIQVQMTKIKLKVEPKNFTGKFCIKIENKKNALLEIY